jgi:hypothetical protein
MTIEGTNLAVLWKEGRLDNFCVLFNDGLNSLDVCQTSGMSRGDMVPAYGED